MREVGAVDEKTIGIDGAERAEMSAELNQLFAEFLEQELSDPTSELSQVYNELLAEETMSDVNTKIVKRLANKGSALEPHEVYFLAGMAGRDDDGNHPFADMGYSDDGGATREQLEKYAEHLRNYLYTYKDEAQSIDPSIDPEEEHVGPMAQDIEKVAPDCVKETPEGVKTVDGNRLALVNAGVIGELSRRVIELEERLNGGGK